MPRPTWRLDALGGQLGERCSLDAEVHRQRRSGRDPGVADPRRGGVHDGAGAVAPRTEVVLPHGDVGGRTAVAADINLVANVSEKEVAFNKDRVDGRNVGPERDVGGIFSDECVVSESHVRAAGGLSTVVVPGVVVVPVHEEITAIGVGDDGVAAVAERVRAAVHAGASERRIAQVDRGVRHL